MQKKWTIWITALMLVTLVVAACAAPATSPAAPADAPAAADSDAAAGEPQQGGTLTMSFGEDVESFDPYYDLTIDMYKPIFYEAPLRITDDGDFEPWLAERFEQAEDGLSVTLYLRRGVMFHNGREMTADDVVWSAELAMNTEPGHHLADRFQTATGAVKVDDYTVRIEYSEQTASQLDGIARMHIFPQEAHETIATVPVGTGPFQFVEWIPGDRLVAERFEDYWQEGKPYLDQIVVTPIPDEQSRLVNLRTGSIDVLYGVPLVEKATLETEEGIVVGETPAGFSFYAFLMNITAPPFDNVLVRQAMHYAVDREKISEAVFFGEAEPVLIPYVRDSWVYPEGLDDYYTYDLDRARELLAEAGYPDGFSVQMLIRGANDPHLGQAQVYQQDLAAIGVQVELVPTELPQYWPQLFESQFSIVSHKTGDATVDPSGLFEGAACCRPFRNFFQITTDTTWFPEYESIITQARGETDREVRKELYREALEIFLEQSWTIPTVWEQAVYAHTDAVEGFRTDLDGHIWLTDTWLDR